MIPLSQTEMSSIVCLCAVELWGWDGESRMGEACFELQRLHHNWQVPAQMSFLCVQVHKGLQGQSVHKPS